MRTLGAPLSAAAARCDTSIVGLCRKRLPPGIAISQKTRSGVTPAAVLPLLVLLSGGEDAEKVWN